MISGTNLLTRCHSASSLFSAVFVFQKSCTGNILGIGRNKSRSQYFTETKTKSGGGTKRRHRAATPALGAAWAWPAPRHGVGPPGAQPTSILRLFISSRENPGYPSLHPRKVSSRPSSPTLVREGSEALPGTLPEREIITGGFYIACLLYTSPSPRDLSTSRMPSSA